MLCSIVRTVEHGAQTSDPPGRREVFFLAPYLPCEHSFIDSYDVRLSMRGRDTDQTRREASALAETFNRCCGVAGITYTVEELQHDDDPARAPA